MFFFVVFFCLLNPARHYRLRRWKVNKRQNALVRRETCPRADSLCFSQPLYHFFFLWVYFHNWEEFLDNTYFAETPSTIPNGCPRNLGGAASDYVTGEDWARRKTMVSYREAETKITRCLPSSAICEVVDEVNQAKWVADRTGCEHLTQFPLQVQEKKTTKKNLSFLLSMRPMQNNDMLACLVFLLKEI